MARLPLTARQVSSAGQPRPARLPLLSRLRGKDEDARYSRRVEAILGGVASLLFLVFGAAMGYQAVVAVTGAFVAWNGLAYVANLEGKKAEGEPPPPTLLARPAVLDGRLVFTLPTMPAETPESIVVAWDETETRVAKLTTFTAPEPYPRLPLFVLREREAVEAGYYVLKWSGMGDGEPMTPARPAVDTWWVLDGRDLWPLKEWLSWQADKVIDRWLAGRVGRGKP